MKKTICIIIISLLILAGFGAFVVPGEEPKDSDEIIISLDCYGDITEITYEITGYQTDTVVIDEREYQQITLGSESQIKEKGAPDLPNICRSIIIPDDKKMAVEIIDSAFVEYENVLIAPSKGILSRTVNPDEVPFTFGETYKKDAYYPDKLATFRNPYIFRDFRGQVVIINPFQYNPVKKTLRVYSQIKVKVYPIGPGEINVFSRPSPLIAVDSAFLPVYQNHFLNYEQNTIYTPVEEQGNMLVICYDSFYSTMVPFVEWKNMKGIPTEIVNVSSIGSGSANDIDSYIDTYYNTNGLTFVLLIGDIAQMPSLFIGSIASDPSYSYISGSDSYPELFIGRFSASNPADLQTQVNRTIMYEKYPQAGASWYHEGVGIGSPEGTGDDGEYDWEHIRNIRADLNNYTYTWVDELYGQTQGGDDAPGDPEPSDITLVLNAGRSIINYCGHGSATSWGWNQPVPHTAYTNSDINSLVNDFMLPFVVCVACDNGEFDDYDECFCEAWLRATNDGNGNPTGAIACTGSSTGMSWDPPMDAQDEMVDILCGLYPTNIKHTIGGIHANGCMHMNDEYGSSGDGETDAWHIFGDPSVEIRTDTPATMTVQHDSSVVDGSEYFEINVVGIQGALCAISHNGELIGYNYTDANGDAYIGFDNPVEDIDDVDLVVTAYNKMPYIMSLPVSPPLRQPAEFEPMQAALIRYPFGIPYDLIAEMSNDAEVVTIVTGASQQATVESQYNANGVDLSNCSFLYAPTDSYWTRDYGPWFIFNYTTSELEVVDFTYNRPRPNDNLIPGIYAANQGLNYSFMGLNHTGGNYMTDGKGTAISTDLVYSENPGVYSDDINQTVRDFLGIRTYYVVPDALGAYIEHIDCWAKYLSPDTIMIIEVPPSNSQYDELEDAVTFFESQYSCYGAPYNVVRVYTPNGEPYVNSLILNDKVFVPQTGSQWDDDAILSYETAMPGYTVLGFDDLSSDPWATTDAIHCRIKGIPDKNMIYIDHDPLSDQMPFDPGFYVEADAVSYSTDVSTVTLYWKNISVGVWNSVAMSSDEETYSAYIPIHACGETIYYYISAENSYGQMYNDPYIGADDPFEFDVTLIPDIWVDPTEFNFVGTDGMLLSDILTVGNHYIAGENLDFNITCTDNDGYGWLSVDTTTGSIPPADELNITVYADTTGLNVGTYSEEIKITSDDPDEPMVTIPVYLSVVLGNDVGATSVNYPTGQQLPGTYIINATIQNYGIYDQNNFVVNCSIYEAGAQLTEDFEASNGGYTHDQGPGVGTIDDWEWGTPTSGPNSAHSGSNVWATNLDGDHSNGADSVLDSVTYDLNLFAPQPQLKYWQWYDHTTYDCGNVKISTDGGATWNIIYPDGGYTGTATSGNQGIPGEPAFTDNSHMYWHQVTFDLTAYEGETVKIRWHFGSTTVTTHPGWYIDDVELSSALIRGPGDIVYYSEETMSVPAYSSKYIEFTTPWSVSNLSYYSIHVATQLLGDQQINNDKTIGVVEISSAPAGLICPLLNSWNFVALPFNQSVSKTNLIVSYGSTEYSWADAASLGYVSNYIFNWNRNIQSYEIEDILEPGEGYWVYTYEPCVLKAPVFNINFDGYITDLKQNWNMIGLPNNVPAGKSILQINYNGMTYSWADAVSAGIVTNVIFGWDEITQSYIVTDTLEPGSAYWIYAYNDCTLLCV